MESKFDKSSDKLNLMMAIKMERKLNENFKDSLINFRIIIVEVKKIENNPTLYRRNKRRDKKSPGKK